ncbi:ROK family protein [Vallitalea maricola]|uniref:ROK family transcriptional regulator n=1 Tax=Vallitalea maricola TaxID=3074433 RepID=A0ACB5UG52_9FIRM|nr:ROK family transcriptional regulator [Vallitalea sp. AN17-2]
MNILNTGINQDKIQEVNRSLVISLLREEGVCSRVNLSNRTGLKQATVTNIINDFINWGLVKEVGFLYGNKGRRAIGIAINTDNYRVIGVRLTRKNYTVGLFDLTDKLYLSKTVETDFNIDPKIIFENITQTISAIIKENDNCKVLAIGVAIPGPFMKKEGRIVLMTEVPGWQNILIEKELENIFHIPVFLEHDANSGAYAELWHSKDIIKSVGLIYIAAGQGIGAGILINQKLLKGTFGFAGEIGHTSIKFDGHKCECGNRGCLEKYCSSIAFTNAVNEELGQKLRFKQIEQLAKEGNSICLNQYKKACEYLGIGIVNMINSFNPDTIIIGDDMVNINPKLMLDTINQTVKEKIIPELYNDLKIGISNIPNSILHGAGIVAINEIFRNPLDFVGSQV